MSDVLAFVAAGAVRGGVLLAAALLASLAMRRSSAAARHAVLSVGVLAQLVVAFAPAMTPNLPVPFPAPETVVVEKAVDHAGASAATIRTPGDRWNTVSESEERGSHSAPVLARLGVALWAGVAAAILLRYLLGHLRVGRLRSRARPAEGEFPRGILSAATRAVDLRRPPDVRLADIPMPVACGIVRPAVLLPCAAVGWSGKRLRMVLVHELAHVRRRDVAIQGLVQLACALFWFDPLLWWARARLRADAESAADDAVLRAGIPADRYVLELVRLLRETVPARWPVAVASIGRDLGPRAVRVLDPRIRRDEIRRRPLTVGVGLALAATLLLGAATPAARDLGAGQLLDGLASGCAWRPDGRHVDRWTEASGQPGWQVLWEGDGCEVEFLARPSPSLSGGILAPPTPGGRLAVRVRRGAAIDSVVLRRDDGGALHVTASAGLAGGTSLPTWLRALADEIALHTAFDASNRVETLLQVGGVPAVLAHAEGTQGGHAAGVYLAQLMASRRLADDELVRALRIAIGHVSSDVVMTELLRAVALRYPVGEPGRVREAFEDAAATLKARAAREAVRRLY